MATPSVFSPKLLLEEKPFALNHDLVNEQYNFSEPDPHHKNVMHGKSSMFSGRERALSCMVFANGVEAFEMSTHLDRLGKTIKIIGYTIDRSYVEYIERVHFGSMEMPPTAILVMDRIPTTTFSDWLKSSPSPSPEDSLSLFSDLFYCLKKIHQDDMFFGNVSGGIRISGNKPMLVFPARSTVMELDEGIWKDLQDLREMVDESMPLTSERILFDDLCDEYVNKARGDKLRDASLLILSSPIVWSSPQRYHFVMKLGEYRKMNYITYDALVSDTLQYGKAIPGIDWYKRLNTGPRGSNESFLRFVYARERCGDPFCTSESIRYFQRCVYEHYADDYEKYVKANGKLQRAPRTVPDMSDILYDVFPEAPSALYKLMIERLYNQTTWLQKMNIKSKPLPPVIGFFWKDPHSLNLKVDNWLSGFGF